jgi:hypothetical protein
MDEDALVRQLNEIDRMVTTGRPGSEAWQTELAECRRQEQDNEFRLSLPTPTSQLVFLTLCRRYGLKAYRESKQRKSTLSVRAPNDFMYAVLKPRVEAMVMAVEEATVAAVRRVMENWSAQIVEQKKVDADVSEELGQS